MHYSDLKPPGEGTWVEFADDRRRLLVYGGPITDPLGTLAGEGWDDFELLSTARALADATGLSEGAERTHLVPAEPVPEASGEARCCRLAAASMRASRAAAASCPGAGYAVR